MTKICFPHQKVMKISYPKRLSFLKLGTVLVVPFVIQLIVTVGIVGLISLKSSQKAVNDLANQLRIELTSRIEKELENYLASPHAINQLNTSAFIQGDLHFSNPTNLSQMFQQSKISPFILGVYCGTEKGEFVGTGRESATNTMSEIYFWLVNRTTNYHFYYYNIDDYGNRLDYLRDDGSYDPRKRPWYIIAKKTKKATWSDIYLDFSTLQPTITAVYPVNNKAGQFLGVCATDLQLPVEFREFLSQLTIGKTGIAFILDRSGHIISSSTTEPLIIGKGESAKMMLGTDSKEPVIQEISAYLHQTFGQLNNIYSPQQLNLKIAGKRQFVEVVPFNDKKGLDWLIVVTVPESDFMEQIYDNTKITLIFTLIALVVAIEIGIITAHRLILPLQRMIQASQEIAGGNLEQKVELSPIIELRILAESFNTMTQQLQKYFKDLKNRETELEELLIAYSRFVPKQFLQFLDKNSIIEVQLGDQVQQEMSVLFSDIRSFTTLSEQMTPQENFQFINSYLSYMSPVITDYQGFIDKYIGDCIMALFSQPADNAVQAGIAMLRKLENYNQKRLQLGQQKISIGIGINTGNLMLGTVGEPNRLDSTVISDAVNVASRIEGLTKHYGVPLLITEYTFFRLEYLDSYCIRMIDRVYVRGKASSVAVFEVFDADSLEIKMAKLGTKIIFEKAVCYYHSYYFEKAYSYFSQCLEINPKDGLLDIYLTRCQQQMGRFRVTVMEQSFTLIKENLNPFCDSFYQLLLEESPEIKDLFKNTDRIRYHLPLDQALEFFISHLLHPDIITECLTQFNQQEENNPLKIEDYSLMINCLLKTLAFYLNESWTSEVQQAWTEALLLVKEMISSKVMG